MAVYQGARRRAQLPLGLDALAGAAARRAGAGARPAADHDARPTSAPQAHSRAASARHTASAVRERSRPPAVGLAIAAIVIIFGAAFLSLSQSVRVAATGYDIVRLVSEHDRLQAIRQDLQSDVRRLWSEPAIRKQALDNGLGQLGTPILVPAR